MFTLLLAYIFEQVDAAADGQEALDQLVENSYDIVFTDLSMPRMSGFQLIQKMQQQSLQQPIIVMSAHDDDVLRQALGTYKIDYLIKPIIFEELLKVVVPICQSLQFENQSY